MTFSMFKPSGWIAGRSSKLQRPDRICLICGDCERRSREVTKPLKRKPSLGRKRKLQTGSAEVNANPSVLTAHLLWRDKVMRLLSLDLMSSSRFWLSLPFSANHRSPLFPGRWHSHLFFGKEAWRITVGGFNSPALKSCEEEVEEMGVDATRDVLWRLASRFLCVALFSLILNNVVTGCSDFQPGQFSIMFYLSLRCSFLET